MIADRDESIGLMEPMLVGETSRFRGRLADLALDLAGRSSALHASLPEPLRQGLAGLVRAMNCYYSNLIEGHHTHPVEIERALRGEYSTDPHKRDLQLEAQAHIAVQTFIDEGGLTGKPTDRASITEIHRRFCEALPADLLVAEDPRTGERLRLEPGALRRCDVKVGRLVPVSPGAVPRFLDRFETAYARLGRVDAVLAAAAAHHRLLWIHPFLDGNGRVARLMSHAMLLAAVDSGALWSVARGLARNEATYKHHLASCDLPRRNDLDGRGSLSEEALSDFTRFFLEVSIDQVDFMRGLMDPPRLKRRIVAWAEEEGRDGRLPQKAGAVLEALLYRGEIGRSEVAGLVGATERHARRVTAALIETGAIASTGPRAPLRLAFPANLAGRWTPGLFPEG